MTQEPLVGHDLLIVAALRSYSDTPYSVGLLWTSVQPDTGTSTWQHTTLQTEKYKCLRRDLNPQSQQVSGVRPTL